MRLGGPFPPRQRAEVVKVIVADADLLVAKGLSTDPKSLKGIRGDRNIDRAQPLDVVAEAGGKPELVGAGFKQKYGRRQEVPAGERCFADLAV